MSAPIAVTARDAAVDALFVMRRGGDFRASTKTLTDARERSLADAITLAIARNATLIDYHIARVSSIPLDKIEPTVIDILRVAAAQLMFLSKIPPSAAVNEGVEQADKRAPRAKGFVNAILRKLSNGKMPPVENRNPLEKLAIEYSHPRWYVEYLVSRFGDGTRAILAADNTPPSVNCVVNTTIAARDDVIASLKAEGADAVPRVGSDVLFSLRASGSITRYTAFRGGLFYVQDAGAYRIAELCGAKSGDTVIDLCAAPGGKSFALAGLMRNNGRILAFDTPERVPLIESGAKRLKLPIITAAPNDATRFNSTLRGVADVVLIDAPCSGFGVIRKKPEIRRKSRESVASLPELQLSILRVAHEYVKRGGKLVYATCTTLDAENERVTDKFLSERSEYRQISREMMPPSLDNDGFYVCVMEKL
ncbi:MAG: 16S rRNA (cytosine(967)-C(5))-methyltransferase RsmB [Oscillospiraceae bacterium]|jgi:16S rRNA (cytosine967-C5)-methyltransferase|nr:16S rRNA (cytosine(967)-C(5))-methyltransferase RsmB [Oscillospiraceae bacterium]